MQGLSLGIFSAIRQGCNIGKYPPPPPPGGEIPADVILGLKILKGGRETKKLLER
jgi:hypothetical protein